MSEITQDRIADAAVRCFERYGAQRTSMSDIAKEAGLSRVTIYRLFEDRPQLVEYILNRIIADLSHAVRAKIAGFDDWRDAVVEGSIASLEIGKSDSLFVDIVTNDTNHSVEQFMFRGTTQIRSDMTETWGPVIDRGREAGEVRPDLSNERIVELIISIHSLLFMRDDYSKRDQRAFLQDFLLPAITGSVTTQS